jgi:hypothetical protein
MRDSLIGIKLCAAGALSWLPFVKGYSRKGALQFLLNQPHVSHVLYLLPLFSSAGALSWRLIS